MTEIANLEVASANGVVVATLSGEIDLSNAAQIRAPSSAASRTKRWAW